MRKRGVQTADTVVVDIEFQTMDQIMRCRRHGSDHFSHNMKSAFVEAGHLVQETREIPNRKKVNHDH
jgi:hypothetical protein